MNEMEEQVISLGEIFEALKKRWILIVLITVLATVAAGVVSFFVLDPVYEVSTKIFVGKEENSEEAYNSNDIAMYQKLLKTYSETIKTRDLVEDAIKGSKYALKVESVIGAVTVVPVMDTQILEIKYQSKNPEEAANTLERLTDEFIDVAMDLVPNGNMRIIESVEIPENPVAPNKVMNVAIAFMLGLMVSVGLVFLMEYMDNTYKTKEQLERELNIPVIGIIPELDN